MFKRKRTGWYILNPKLSVRSKDEWVDVYRHAGLDLIGEIGRESGNRFREMAQYVQSP